MKLLDLEHQSMDIPERDDDIVVTFPSLLFQNLIKDLIILGQEVHIIAEEEHVKFKVESDTGKGGYTLPFKENSIESSEYVNDVSQLFSLKYLSNFTKPCSFCQRLELRMKENDPLVLKFELPGMTTRLIDNDESYGTLVYFLAPKVDE
jgi:proliferating cell nuclear antigen PCNA